MDTDLQRWRLRRSEPVCSASPSAGTARHLDRHLRRLRKAHRQPSCIGNRPRAPT